jgi:hypothetical protein
MRCDKVLLAAGVLATASAAFGQDRPDGHSADGVFPHLITVSDSPTDWDSLDGAPFIGERTLYVWLAIPWYKTHEWWFTFESSFQLVELVPAPGFQNLGSLDSPFLTTPECQYQPVVLAELRVLDSGGQGGQVCVFADSALCSRLCDEDATVATYFWGYETNGNFCDRFGQPELCPNVVPVEPESWGRMKARYRR